MNKSSIFAAVASAALLATAVTGMAEAQNWQAAPTYGNVSLRTGFAPDPYRVNVLSGGPINASTSIGGSCRGYIANAPDFDLYFTAGSSLPLIISVSSNADTTLVVRAPNGLWYCDDDSGQGLNPSVRFNTPMSGLYDIWVGTYGNASNQQAQINISELYSQ
ncbi:MULTISPECIES: peptidase S1 [Hyphobacterium]|uniref:Peptidase S1 n=1 Tax=Hyphobacterium vulgare TaxID=1736751 RepID=A0ABV6ZVN9_9PROT